MEIIRVTVKKDGVYYICHKTLRGFKCGKCLFGLINPYGSKAYQNYRCRRCGAELSETVSGGSDFRSYQSYSL